VKSALLAEESPSIFLSLAIEPASILWQVSWLCLWLLPNFVLRLAARDVYAENGIFNIDLLLCGAIALFLPAAWSPALLLLSVAVDLIEGILRTWLFRPEDLLQAFSLLPSLPLTRSISYLTVALFGFGGFGYAAWILRLHTTRRFRTASAATLVSMAALFVGIDMLCEGRSLSGARDVQGTFYLARVPEHGLLRNIHELYQRRGWSGAGQPIESASDRLIRKLPGLSAGQRPDIVEIVVESWGADDSGIIDKRLLSLYETPQIRNRYQIITGYVPFTGLTVYGETRELCDSTIGFAILRNPVSSSLGPCLPMRMKAMGYRTLGVHGYFGGMYGRYLWYPRLGFDSVWFMRRLHSQGLTDCKGAFPGICDAQIAEWLGNQLARTPTPLFVHWMTLNSHLPLPSRLSGLNDVGCEFDPLVRDREPLCAWFKLEYQVHSSIAALASRNDIPPSAFVIVGDHQPPFASPDLRGRFADNQVPFLLLIPKDAAASRLRAATPGITTIKSMRGHGSSITAAR
jgi:hypothetical protein